MVQNLPPPSRAFAKAVDNPSSYWEATKPFAFQHSGRCGTVVLDAALKAALTNAADDDKASATKKILEEMLCRAGMYE